MKDKNSERKLQIPKLITFDFIWKTGGIIAVVWGYIFPILDYHLKGSTFKLEIKLDTISLGILLSAIIGITFSSIYHIYQYTKKVNLALRIDKIEKTLESVTYVETCTDEELQEAIANSD